MKLRKMREATGKPLKNFPVSRPDLDQSRLLKRHIFHGIFDMICNDGVMPEKQIFKSVVVVIIELRGDRGGPVVCEVATQRSVIPFLHRMGEMSIADKFASHPPTRIKGTLIHLRREAGVYESNQSSCSSLEAS